MAAETIDDGSSEKILRVINVDRAAVLRRLKQLKAKSLSKYLSRSVTFELEPEKGNSSLDNERKYNTWLRVSTAGQKTTLSLKDVPTPRRLPMEHRVEVDDFFQTVKIIKAVLHGVDYSYMEIDKESYGINKCTVTITQWPYMSCELDITGPSTKEIMALYRDLGIKGEISHALNVPESVYYKLRGFDYELIKQHYKNKLEALLPK